MGFRAKEAVATRSHRRTEIETKHAANLVVEFLLRIFTAEDAFFIGIGKIIVVVSVGHALTQAVGPGTELHVKAVLHSLVGIMGTSPVAHNDTVELPISFQNLVKQIFVVAVVFIFI